MKKLFITAAAMICFTGNAFASSLPSNVILQPAQPARVSKPVQNQVVANHNATNVNNQVVKTTSNPAYKPAVKQTTSQPTTSTYKPATPVASAVHNNVSSQKTSINQCSETVSVNSEQLFYLTLSALNKMNYKIKEVQSKTGTVLFQVAQREFMVTIADLGANKTFIKILPTDSDYGFSPSLIQNVFYFVKANAGVTPTIL